MGDSTRLESIPFHGATINAIRTDEGVHVAIRPVCEAIGLAYSGQHERLERQPWATVRMTRTVAEDGKHREMATVDRRTFTMWLATVDTTRLKNDDARDMLVIFQREAADALDAYFNEGGAINPRATEHQINALIFQARAQMELCQAAKGLIHPDHLEARARVVLARGLGEKPELDAGKKPLYTQDFLREKNLSTSRMKSVAGVFGKRVKAAYVLRHGCDPDRYPLNLPNGQVREVNAYTEEDRDLLEQVWTDHYAGATA